MIKDVLLIFKTHLDIGFTDLAENVTKKYLESYIPNAIKMAYKQKDTDCPFIWTTGSWLINLALKQDDGSLEKAIRDGLIKWHGFPFTSHTEYMNPEMLEYCLSISKELDERFGRKTIAAKMSDVPGHTIGMVPYLADAEIELLHIGVNPATPVPNVPEVFTWKCGDKSINVMYNGGGYGKCFEFEDFAVSFCVTGDNLGAQSSEELEKLYDDFRKQYPGAVVRAATLDDVALKLRGKKLPVIESEIGDNWIHGVGTDPTKTRLYRAILRSGKRLSDYDLDENLMLVAEHTWGMDQKTHFDNYKSYFLHELEGAEGKEHFEASWAEQREYVFEASRRMGIDLTEEMSVEIPNIEGAKKCDQKPGMRVFYQLFDREDYARYKKDYLQIDMEWADYDFLKVGLPEYEGGIFEAKLSEAYEKGEQRIFRLEFDEEITKMCGLPMIYVLEENGQYEVRWFGKKNNRLPEAFWVKFDGLCEDWELLKMGKWIEPDDCIGMKNLHCVFGARNGEYEIENLDAPLAAPFGPRMLTWDQENGSEDLYFNLYNNIWNTNFPMWFSDDAKFRFMVRRVMHGSATPR